MIETPPSKLLTRSHKLMLVANGLCGPTRWSSSPLASEISALNIIWLVRAFQVSSAVFAVYDHIICIDQEVDLIWKQHWSMAKLLYIWNRYLGNIYVIGTTIISVDNRAQSPEFCYKYLRVQGWVGASLVWSMQLILLFRIYAMYSKSANIALFLGACFLAEIAAMAAITGTGFAQMGAAFVTIASAGMCVPTNPTTYIYAVWLSVVAFETILVMLAGYMGIRYIMHTRSRPGRILTILLRDSLVYFIVIIAVNIANSILWFVSSGSYIDITAGLTVSLTIVTGCRLILNLREAYWMPFDPEIRTSSNEANGIPLNQVSFQQNSEVFIAIESGNVPTTQKTYDQVL